MQSIKAAAMPDAELIDRIRNGETALFEILIKRNNPFLYKVGMSYGFTHHDVEDLMQESFLAAYLSLYKFEQRSSFKTWVIRIMLGHCYKKAHKANFKNEKSMDLAGSKIALYPQQKDPHKSILNRELKQIIETSILQIPFDYRMVFSLREIAGMNTAETAETLEITKTNVKVRLNRARRILRKVIEKRYSIEEIFEFHLLFCNTVTENVMIQLKIYAKQRLRNTGN